jgi:hypothetical protein
MPMVASNKADLRKFAQLHISSGGPNNVRVVRNGPLGKPFEALGEMRPSIFLSNDEKEANEKTNKQQNNNASTSRL